MQLGLHFLKSKIARRFFTLFLLSALLPMAVFVWVSYQRVNDQLYEQSSRRLRSDTKAYGMALMDRLIHTSNLLELLSSYDTETIGIDMLPANLKTQLESHFDLIVLFRLGSDTVSLLGDDEIKIKEQTLINIINKQGNTIIHEEDSEGSNNVLLAIPYLSEFEDTPHLLIGKPNASYLWGLGASSVLPPLTELAIYGEDGSSMVLTSSSPGKKLPQFDLPSANSNFFEFEYNVDDESFLASGWPLFLQSYFDSETWTVILSEAKSDSLKAVFEFKKLFPLVVALTLWIVLFLSLFFIRKTLEPLNALRKGTEKVGVRDFTSKVDIKSGDEFEQLADSFNLMADQLSKQFSALEVRSDIDRSILSSLDQSVLVPRALRMMHEFFKCRSIVLVQNIKWEQSRAEAKVLRGASRNNLDEKTIIIEENDKSILLGSEEFVLLKNKDQFPKFFDGLLQANTTLILPLSIGQDRAGALILDFQDTESEELSEEISQARQLANQLSVALSNSKLYSDLEKLSIGTVEALARTVDAKSKWTAGHSERVAELAVRIARIMGFSLDDQNKIYRAGLLHDIGKIGVPVRLLDKPGKLSDEEYEQMKTHPEIGGKILEPIEVYRDIIPIIVQHHERYDGEGYPLGLTGEEIDPSARILCIADVYDALVNQRPYREGWIKEKTTNFIKQNSGVMFDPTIVNAFLSMDN